MTLDEFQQECERVKDLLKSEVFAVLQKGVDAKLDPMLMMAIFNRTMDKGYQEAANDLCNQYNSRKN